MKTMKALVKKYAKPGIWMDEVPVPEYGPNDVLIKVHKTSICGTDIHIYNWDEWAQKTIPVPMHVGHEYVGTVEARRRPGICLLPESLHIRFIPLAGLWRSSGRCRDGTLEQLNELKRIENAPKAAEKTEC